VFTVRYGLDLSKQDSDATRDGATCHTIYIGNLFIDSNIKMNSEQYVSVNSPGSGLLAKLCINA
jgi:hypothetical protein